MPRFALLLLAFCLMTRTSADPQSDDEDLAEDYREVRDALRKIFARGVDPTQQEPLDASPASRRGTVAGMVATFWCPLVYYLILMQYGVVYSYTVSCVCVFELITRLIRKVVHKSG